MRRYNDRDASERGLARYSPGPSLAPSSPFWGFGASPWQMMRRMQDEMDQLFGRFFGPPGEFGTLAQVGQQWAPSVDVSESDKEWCIEADLPGVRKEDIDLEVQGDHLILRAEMRSEQPPQGGQQQEGQRRYQTRERRYGFFERVLPLPENVKQDDISCDFSNGVLTVHLPKTEQRQPPTRRIPISEGQAAPSGGQSQTGSTTATGKSAGRSQKAQAPTDQSHEPQHEEEEETAAAGTK